MPSDVRNSVAQLARELANFEDIAKYLKPQPGETPRLEGVEVRVYSAAKTVADCFKYRNKVGVDVAIEALRDFGRRHRGRAADLARYAQICRVSRVMQPYMDAIA